jgi:L-rhamnose mutarotase
MIRKAFRMSVHPGQAGEYERRHNPIWPDLEAVLLAHGVRSYSIFLDDTTNDLFAYAEIESEAQWAAIADTDVCRRWWAHMRPLMPTEAGPRASAHGDAPPRSSDSTGAAPLRGADASPDAHVNRQRRSLAVEASGEDSDRPLSRDLREVFHIEQR